MYYVTFQIRPAQFFKDMGFQTRKFAVACEDGIDLYGVFANLNSVAGISYLRGRHSKPRKGTIILPEKNNAYLKYIHL